MLAQDAQAPTVGGHPGSRVLMSTAVDEGDAPLKTVEAPRLRPQDGWTPAIDRIVQEAYSWGCLECFKGVCVAK